MATRISQAANSEVVAVEASLAVLDSTTLARMMLQVARGPGCPPRILDVTYLPAHTGRGGGFTYVIKEFLELSERGTHAYSPWVELGGLKWGLHTYPRGGEDGERTHLSGGNLAGLSTYKYSAAVVHVQGGPLSVPPTVVFQALTHRPLLDLPIVYLVMDMESAAAAGVASATTCDVAFTVLDHSGEGQHLEAPRLAHKFNNEASGYFGWEEGFPLSTLRSASFIKDGALHLRVQFAITNLQAAS
jgi:hypothetical protein